MKIRLLVDYRGVLTEENYFVAGEYEAPGDMPVAYAKALIADRRAEEIKTARPDNREPEQEPKPKRRVTRRKKA